MAKNKKPEGIGWYPVATVRKYDRDGNFIEEVTSKGNLLTESGRARLADLLIGEGTGPLASDNVRLGVGSDDTAADSTDTNLSLFNEEYYQLMDVGFPSSTNGVLTFAATYEDDEANFLWQCWGLDVDDAGSVIAGDTPVDLFNRKVFNFGEKDGGTWLLTVTVSSFNPNAT